MVTEGHLEKVVPMVAFSNVPLFPFAPPHSKLSMTTPEATFLIKLSSLPHHDVRAIAKSMGIRLTAPPTTPTEPPTTPTEPGPRGIHGGLRPPGVSPNPAEPALPLLPESGSHSVSSADAATPEEPHKDGKKANKQRRKAELIYQIMHHSRLSDYLDVVPFDRWIELARSGVDVEHMYALYFTTRTGRPAASVLTPPNIGLSPVKTIHLPGQRTIEEFFPVLPSASEDLEALIDQLRRRLQMMNNVRRGVSSVTVVDLPSDHKGSDGGASATSDDPPKPEETPDMPEGMPSQRLDVLAPTPPFSETEANEEAL